MISIDTYKSSVYSKLVERIWFISNDDEEVEVMLPPNQYINIVIPINGSWYRLNNEIVVDPQIEGVSLKSHKIYYPANSKFLGIRFYPYGMFPFLEVEGANISNNSIGFLPNLNESIKPIIKQIQNATIKEDQIKLVNHLLNALFEKERFDQIKNIREYYKYFRGDNAAITIEDFCSRYDTNYTSLNRRFKQIIGISPKRFERLIKFRKALCDLIDSNSILTEIGLKSGYFDQAHFIREFKLFLDCKPMAYQKLIKEADKDSQVVNYNFRLF